MFRTALQVLNPLHKKGFFALPHILLITTVAVISFGAGWFGGSKYTAQYFEARYRASQPIPTTRARVTAPHVALASSGSINVDRYPAVGDQDGQGSCAAWATAWDLAYEWRILHSTSWLRFSPRQMYDHYSTTYSGGADGGSWPDQDAEIAPTDGLLQFKALPEPPYVIDNPIPTYDAWGHLTATDAAKHRFIPTFHALQGFAQGGGQGLVDSIRQTIASGHPVMIALPVYPEYDNATAQPNIVGPSAGETARGAHENVAIAYDDTRPMPDGTQGAVEVQNQWNTWWGISGRAWLSYSFVRQYVFGSEWASIAPVTATHASRVPPSADGSNTNLHQAPPTGPMPPQPSAGSWYVHGVRATTGQDLSPLLNHWGDVYHISPIGLAATVGVESALNPYAERWAGGLDNSCGLAQQIITNVAYYTGIFGAQAECAWEEVPANSIYLEARIYREYFNYLGSCAYFSPVYAAYNGGAGIGCAGVLNPYGDIAAHVAVFNGWYDIALSRWAGGSPPAPPKPKRPRFGHLRARVWSQFRKEHHLSFIPHNGWYAWHWRRGDFRRAGGIVRHETYDARQHVMTEYLQGGFAWFWPGHPQWHTRWQGRSRWLR